ncbi:MAG: carboxypeptidase regulatory-like domain-containing protein [Isosphaeraceae bacterium]
MHVVALVVIVLAQPAPAAPLPLGEPLVGTIVDHVGRPVTGVEVLLSSGLPPSGERPAVGGVFWMRHSPAMLGGRHPVLARGRTDDAGRFQIQLPALVLESQEPLPVALWAYRAGSRVAWRRLPWATPAPLEPIRLVLEQAPAWGFQVLGNDGSPEAGARVWSSAIDRLSVPDELAARIVAETGRDGTAAITAFAPGEIRGARVVSTNSGAQTFSRFGRQGAETRIVRLEPVGRVAGRVVTDSDKPVSGLRLEARTFPEGYDTGGTVGSAEVVTDVAGRFEIAAIAAGRLALVLDFRSLPDLPYRGFPPDSQVVETGGTTTVEIRLKRAVRVEGVVRERGTGVPIAGVSPMIPDPAIRRGGNPWVVTDAGGEFHGYMEGDQPYAFIYATPKPYFVPSDAPDTFHLLSAGATEFKLPPAELARGESLGGTVVDETGKFVRGALVRATWDGKEVITQSVAARTGPSGTFLLDGLDPLADLRLTAEADGLATTAPQTARARAGRPVKLVVSRANTVVLAGRVVDTSGKPIPGAEVSIQSQTRTSEGQVWRVDPIVYDDRDLLITDNNGRFQTPYGVPKDLEYEARVRVAGMRPGRTVWLKPGAAPTAVFGDLVLRRLRAVEGIVRDRQGKPVAGAAVFQSGDGPLRTRDLTDSQGRFRVRGLIEGTAILFARKDGFRFHGQPIDTEAGAANLVLTRSNEAPPLVKTLAGVLPRDAERALARRLLAPYVEKVMAKGTDIQKYQTLVALGPVDPARTLELLEAQGAGKPQFALDSLRSRVASELAGESPDEAVSLAESIRDPEAKSWSLTEVVDELRGTDRARKVELLAQAQLQARAAKQPGVKLQLLSRVAERWLDLGEKDRALALIGEGRELAKEVPPPGYESAVFAQALARVDFPAALALNASARSTSRRADRVNRVFVFDRSYGEIAYRLANQDPAGAERALGLIDNADRRSGYVVAACSRMASKDLPRARRLAETIDDPLARAYAQGVMARGLAAVDNAAAARMLDLAFDRLEEHGDDVGSSSNAAGVAAVLLEAVERVAPARLEESVWRAAALRPALAEELGEGSNNRADAELAMNLARYHRAAAAAVLARAVAAFATTDADTHRQAFVAMALALIDPLRAVALVESLPDEPGLDRTLPKNAARLYTAEILAKEGQARWQKARNWGVSLWTPQGFNR